jgi:outer membrane protein OmpA-like peptidoglycan-associated protein
MRFHIIGGSLKGYNLAATNGGGGSYKRSNSQTRWWFPMGYDGSNPMRGEEGSIGKIESDYLDIGHWKKFQEKGLLTPDVREGNVIGFWQEFNYAVSSIDVEANITHLMRGFYKESPLEVIGIIGGGYVQAFDNKLTTPNYGGLILKAGMRLALNLSPKLAFYVEPQACYVPDPEFDGYIGTAPGEAILNVGMGLQYTFNRNYEAPVHGTLSLDEINYLNEKINNNRTMIEKNKNILDRHQDLLDRLNQCCEEGVKSEREIVTQTEVITTKYLPEYIRFALNSAQIQLTEESKLRDAVEFMKANPSSKLLLVGYADKKTGTSSYNYDLSRKRVEGVKQELIRRGVDPKRLILEWRGDTEQPYVPNDWNRVVIIVER